MLNFALLQVKVSHESVLSRSCAMCVNYERQLQKLQDENQKFQNLASNLQVALDQEKVHTCSYDSRHGDNVNHITNP